MPDEPVLTERRDGVLLITLNRPEARNAVNLALAEGVAAALDELDADGDLAVGVITGAGAGFCAGMDLKAFVTGERPWVGDRGFAGIVQRASRKPLIAAIEGFAVAGGLEVALACDLIVAAREAKLGIPEVKRSLVAAGGALMRLPRRVPYGIAMELALTGDTITAERAYELGLVNRLAERGGAVDAALELAGAIAANGPLALDATKAILQQQFDWSEEEFWQRQGELSGPVFGSRTRARARSPSRRSATRCGRDARSKLTRMSAAAAALPAPATRSRREITVVFAALMLAVLLAALDGTIVATALPTITAELGGLEPALVGRHRLPAGLDDLDAALRQARRPLRAQARLPGLDRHLPHRLGAVRTGPGHGRADRLPHAPGPRRRRAHRPVPRRSSATSSRRAIAAATRASSARSSG